MNSEQYIHIHTTNKKIRSEFQVIYQFTTVAYDGKGASTYKLESSSLISITVSFVSKSINSNKLNKLCFDVVFPKVHH